MRTTIFISLPLFFLSIFICGIVFKGMHWPAWHYPFLIGGTFLISSLLVLAKVINFKKIIRVINHIAEKTENDNLKKKNEVEVFKIKDWRTTIYIRLPLLFLSIFICGYIFKVMHWPGWICPFLMGGMFLFYNLLLIAMPINFKKIERAMNDIDEEVDNHNFKKPFEEEVEEK